MATSTSKRCARLVRPDGTGNPPLCGTHRCRSVKTNGRCKKRGGCIWRKHNKRRRTQTRTNGVCEPRMLHRDMDVQLLKVLGEGTQGKVYSVCYMGDCHNFVAKEVPKGSIDNACGELAGELGIGPRILGTVAVKNKMYVLSLRLHATMDDLVKRGGKVTPDDRRQVSQLITRLLQAGWLHADIRGDNVMYRQSADGKRRWYLIDFDLAVKIDTIGYTRYDAVIQGMRSIEVEDRSKNRSSYSLSLNDRIVKSHRPKTGRSKAEMQSIEKIAMAKKRAREMARKRRAKALARRRALAAAAKKKT